ncbi:MAG: hypothetical protein RL069_2180, partial [Planctomycetota bacterium]
SRCDKQDTQPAQREAKKKRPLKGWACAIPLPIQAELREQPGDLSGAARAAR